MPARRFKLIAGDNNIADPARTTKHLIVIPGRKVSSQRDSQSKVACTFQHPPVVLKRPQIHHLSLQNNFTPLYHIQAGVGLQGYKGSPAIPPDHCCSMCTIRYW
ncbi:unnamed protein product [Pleuronectes platessa]|uniref:Uncharacterized protein n=1 Tax=Pleuronectes platessa TaxID=8262 RepID=A0A9N7YV28_PLEPL|nr:unnamed protein product [Pleuronectes platessa]